MKIENCVEMKTLKDIVLRIDRGLSSHYTKDGTFKVQMISIKDIDNSEINSNNIEYVNVRDKTVIEKARIQPGEILLASKGNYYKSALVKQKDSNYIISSNIILLKVKNQILPEFVVAYLNSPIGQKELSNKATGSYIKYLNIDSLLDIPIPIPSIEKQKLIKNYLEIYHEYKNILKRELDLRDVIAHDLLICNGG